MPNSSTNELGENATSNSNTDKFTDRDKQILMFKSNQQDANDKNNQSVPEIQIQLQQDYQIDGLYSDNNKSNPLIDSSAIKYKGSHISNTSRRRHRRQTQNLLRMRELDRRFMALNQQQINAVEEEAEPAGGEQGNGRTKLL